MEQEMPVDSTCTHDFARVSRVSISRAAEAVRMPAWRITALDQGDSATHKKLTKHNGRISGKITAETIHDVRKPGN